MEEVKDKIENPQELDNIGRNTDGTFKTGHNKVPGSGRPKNTLKDYVRAKFSGMTDEEKEQWIKDNKISGIDIWKMGEGNPKQDTDVTSNGESLQILFDNSFQKKDDTNRKSSDKSEGVV